MLRFSAMLPLPVIAPQFYGPQAPAARRRVHACATSQWTPRPGAAQNGPVEIYRMFTQLKQRWAMQILPASPGPVRRIRNPANSAWCRAIFDTQVAARGGVVRRALRDVEREIGFATLELEVRRRGFHVVQSGDHLLIICNAGDLRVIC
jgi:hypothetical protein